MPFMMQATSWFMEKVRIEMRLVPFLCQRYASSSIRPLSPESRFSIQEAHQLSKQWLKERQIEDYDESSRYLLCHLKEIGSYRYSDFVRNADTVLSLESITRLNEMLIERAAFKPIQYILGNWDFYGETYLCRPPVPETEELVDLVIQEVRRRKIALPLRILDIGCGSGIIGISLLKNIANCSVVAIDQSKDAVTLTQENAQRLLTADQLVKFACQRIDYHKFIDQFEWNKQFDIIVSNPPYIPSFEIETLQEEVRLYEDRKALDGGIDGLDLANDIISTCPALLKVDGLRLLWMELSREHPASLHKRFCGNSHITTECFDDFTKNPRFIRFQFS